MKKLIFAILLPLLVSVNTFAQQTKPEDIKATIGVAKIIAHPALDAIEKGLQDELKEQGFKNLTFDLQSANGEISTAASIANKFRTDKVDIAVGIATPMALSLANTLKDTPVVFSAVTDPVDAGLRKNLTTEKTNVTGVSDQSPVIEQIALIKKLINLKTLGFIYNAGEANSIVVKNELEKICKDAGIKLLTDTVTNTSEVAQAAQVLSPRVDAIYVSTDNVVAAAINSVTSAALKEKKAVVGADPVTAANTGALAAYGVDYYKVGRHTGKIIADILRGKKAGNIPVKFMTQKDELMLFIDKAVAKKINVKIPAELNK